MATILDNVKAKQGEFLQSPVSAGQNMAMAIAAAKEGIKSPAWQFYMSQFVSRNQDGSLDKEQLARLMATDDTLGDPVMDRHRAYLLGNAFCGFSTTDWFHVGIASIDNGLGVECLSELPECELITELQAGTTKKPAVKYAPR